VSKKAILMDSPKVSIIIPLKNPNKHLEECIEHCLQLDYPDYEILILPDSPVESTYPKVTVIPTGVVGPAQKRDLAISEAKGEILAFLDDDAFPQKEWLKNAIKYFENPDIAAVGGPAVTPQNDGFMQKASGLVYASFLCAGKYAYRYVPRKKREVDDYPSCNFLVRKSVMEKLGGFDTKFWPGEDTKLCLKITNDLGKKIIYAPDVLVYHHRRPLFVPHLKQIWSYAVHRGYFVKKFPETSLRLSYFLPTIFVIGMVVGFLFSLISYSVRMLYAGALGIYFLATFVSSLFQVFVSEDRNLSMVLFVFPGIILTHICYGIGFLKGLFSRKLKEEA